MWSLIVSNGWVLTKRPTQFCSFIHLQPNTKPHRVTHQARRVLSRKSTGEMKRKVTDSDTDVKIKRQREPDTDYCDVIPQKDSHGNAIWPASEQSIKLAREFFKEW